MLAGAQSRFLLLFSVAFLVVAVSPVQAQINGVPASVTSFGFGGNANPTPGVRASVTSLGPNGYGNSRPIFEYCCANFFLPPNPNPPLFFGRHHRRHEDRNLFAVGVSEPVYVPYAVPYVQNEDDDAGNGDEAEADEGYTPDARSASPPTGRAGDRRAAARADAIGKPVLSQPERPVTRQPATVLIFKDGHQSDVMNYAIVGDFLFDFEAGHTHKIPLADIDLPATHKVNDDRGVDFQIPGDTTR